MEIVPLTSGELVGAAALLTARHAGERELHPLMPIGPADPAVAAAHITDLMEFCDGVAARDRHGELIGFLSAFEQVPDPTSPVARYLPARALVSLSLGHAVAPSVEPAPVYAAMFGALAERAVDLGIVDFVVHVPVGRAATEAAWVALGFGRSAAVAVRDLAPVGVAPPSDVDIRVAGPDDLDIVDRLVDHEAIHHAAGPIFRPYVREDTTRAVRDELAAALVADDQSFFVARRGGEDVGVLSVGRGFGYLPESAYIAATAVLPAARRSGIGTALTERAITWSRERGYGTVSLHFATANQTSSSFWTGVGFVPVMVHLRRRVDDRILAHRPSLG